MTTLSRRHLVTSAAALPMLAVPAATCAFAQEPDPIFAAIEKYEALDAESVKIWDLEPDARDANGRHLSDTPEYRGWEASQIAVDDKRYDAKVALLATVPTTAAGALALVECHARYSACFCEEDVSDLFDSLGAFLERAAVQS